MVIKNIDFEKYNKMAEKSFYRKLGKVVNVVGLTIESAGSFRMRKGQGPSWQKW